MGDPQVTVLVPIWSSMTTGWFGAHNSMPPGRASQFQSSWSPVTEKGCPSVVVGGGNPVDPCWGCQERMPNVVACKIQQYNLFVECRNPRIISQFYQKWHGTNMYKPSKIARFIFSDHHGLPDCGNDSVNQWLNLWYCSSMPWDRGTSAAPSSTSSTMTARWPACRKLLIGVGCRVSIIHHMLPSQHWKVKVLQ